MASKRREKKPLARFKATLGDVGKRPDRALRARYPQIDRTRALALLKGKQIKVNGVVARLSTILAEGDSVKINDEKLGAPVAHGILVKHFEGGLFVVQKPAGLAMHEGTGIVENLRSSLITLLPGRGLKESRVTPRFFGRLDRPTSGLVLGAITDSADKKVRPYWENGEIEKVYLALVHGRTKEEALVDHPLARRKEQHRGKGESEEARTRYKALFRSKSISLLRVKLETGRTHQIRRHMKGIGHPIIGDLRYGDHRLDERLVGNSQGELDGLYLHCHAFIPSKDIPLMPEQLSADFPPRFASLLQSLGAPEKYFQNVDL